LVKRLRKKDAKKLTRELRINGTGENPLDKDIPLRGRDPNAVEVEGQDGSDDFQSSLSFLGPVPGSLSAVLLLALASARFL